MRRAPPVAAFGSGALRLHQAPPARKPTPRHTTSAATVLAVLLIQRYLTLIFTVFAAAPATVRTTSPSPRPARLRSINRFTWSIPGYCGCTANAGVADVPPMVAVIAVLEPRV